MPRAHRTLLVPVILGALALTLVLATAGPAAAQPRIPTSSTWEALPYVLGEGATVVVRTRDGNAVKGRLQRLSDTAIVLDGGKVRTIPAASIVSIEGRRGPRRVWDGAEAGFSIGAFFVGLALAANGEVSPDLLVLPVFCAGIGAGIGAVIPGKRTLLYAVPTSSSVALAPIAGHGRRGAAVRVAF
jgi:hypothetical protein